MSTSVITLDDMVATLTFIGTPSSHPECGLHNIQPTRASLNTLHSYRTMYFLVIDDRACQIFDRSKIRSNGLPWWSTCGASNC